jgi:hypothetical protein
MTKMNTPTENEILNSGLDFAMEFGEHWLQAIQERLAKKYDFLHTEQLNHYDLMCRKAMKDGHKFMHNTLVALSKEKRTISSKELEAKLTSFMQSNYPWIDHSNLSRLFSQSCYYAYKDGLHHGIK